MTPSDVPVTNDVVTLSIRDDKPGFLQVKASGPPQQVLAWLNQAAEMMRIEATLAGMVERAKAAQGEPRIIVPTIVPG